VEKTALPTPETQALIRQYFSAFSNLYGIIPMRRALQIIRQQNPDLELDEAQFTAFLESLDENVRHFLEEDPFNGVHYIVCGPEEIDYDIEETTPPMEWELITEYMYASDGFESYYEVKEKQEGKPFYIPEKENLLRYADDNFREKPPAYYALNDFLRNKIKLLRVSYILDDLCLGAYMRCNLNFALSNVNRLEYRNCFEHRKTLEAFAPLYLELVRHTRQQSNRGYTYAELGIPVDDEEAYSGKMNEAAFRKLTKKLDDELRAIRYIRSQAHDLPEPPKAPKVGRNDPCPCGSGKKYKKCCGR